MINTLNYIDIHAHLNFPDFDNDREELIATMARDGVGAINVGTSLPTSRAVLTLAENHSHLWAIVGIHPHEAEADHDLDELQSLADSPLVVAIGECGLDYFRQPAETLKKRQQSLFESQIKLASKLGKPLMLHVRDSYREVLDILKAYPEVKTHAHFFAGDKTMAREFLDRGDTISFTGVITFTDAYDEIVRYIPLDRLLAETDCPYVAPTPHRGRRSDPTHVSLVVAKLAQLKNLPEPELAKIIIANARETFKLDHETR